MDTRPEYILQCEKAEEIQKLKTPIIPVSLYRLSDGKILDGNTGDYIATIESNDCVLRYKYIWLPRQDQLQEMLNDFPEIPKGIINKLYKFADFVHKIPYLPKAFKDIEKDEACHFFTSMEQLWLVFVMKEKYGKTWDGNNWAK